MGGALGSALVARCSDVLQRFGVDEAGCVSWRLAEVRTSDYSAHDLGVSSLWEIRDEKNRARLQWFAELSRDKRHQFVA